jgi:hypothetical protein
MLQPLRGFAMEAKLFPSIDSDNDTMDMIRINIYDKN